MTRPHLPLRPVWLCRVCAHPWPCGPAKLALRAEYDKHALSLNIYLADHMIVSLRDLSGIGESPEVTSHYARFLGWAAPRRT